MVAQSIPWLSNRCPPVTMSRPSGRKVWLEQNKLIVFPLWAVGWLEVGVDFMVPRSNRKAWGSHSFKLAKELSVGWFRRPQKSTFLLCNRCAWMATSASKNGADH